MFRTFKSDGLGYHNLLLTQIKIGARCHFGSLCLGI